MFPFTFCSFSPQLRLKARTCWSVNCILWLCIFSQVEPTSPLFCRPFGREGTLVLDNQGHSLVLAFACSAQLTLSFWPRIFRHRPKCSRIAQRFCQGTESIGMSFLTFILHSHVIKQPRTLRDQRDVECLHCCQLVAGTIPTFASLSPNVSQSCRHCEPDLRTDRNENAQQHTLTGPTTFMLTYIQEQLAEYGKKLLLLLVPACSYPQPAAGSAALACLNRHPPVSMPPASNTVAPGPGRCRHPPESQ
ncbi:hypothetical protein Pelo_5395 [Pelomyxa schiedti]|nr:hypothetical protein Pelo_5395 [Pelomyxa schiedti]